MEIQKAAVERGEGFCLGRRVMESRGKRTRVTVGVAKDVLVVHPVVPSAWEPTYQFPQSFHGNLLFVWTLSLMSGEVGLFL